MSHNIATQATGAAGEAGNAGYGNDFFVPIPGKPGYRIDAKGRVESEISAHVLVVDRRGRVVLRLETKRKNAFIGDLLAAAGFFASGPEAWARPKARADDAALRVALLETEVKRLVAALKKSRGASTVLLGIRSALNAENARLKAVGALRMRAGRKGYCAGWDAGVDAGWPSRRTKTRQKTIFCRRRLAGGAFVCSARLCGAFVGINFFLRFRYLQIYLQN